MRSAVIVLTVYSEYILLRSFIVGIQGVDKNLVEVAYGMGWLLSSSFQYRLWSEL